MLSIITIKNTASEENEIAPLVLNLRNLGIIHGAHIAQVSAETLLKEPSIM